MVSSTSSQSYQMLPWVTIALLFKHSNSTFYISSPVYKHWVHWRKVVYHHSMHRARSRGQCFSSPSPGVWFYSYNVSLGGGRPAQAMCKMAAAGQARACAVVTIGSPVSPGVPLLLTGWGQLSTSQPVTVTPSPSSSWHPGHQGTLSVVTMNPTVSLVLLLL